nr:interferon-induced very large GTPase 1 [Danio rerio]|eukprot:XP_021327619.1 interferon-induced very large GTPase 1 [Danio rerio]
MRQTLRCVSRCHPGVHAFLLIIPDAPLNNEDRGEMQEIQKIFSSRINKHIMILIMQNSEHQTAELNEETQAVIQSFGGRHHHFSPETQVSTLMENIEQMLEENRGGVYSTETFLEAQMKKLVKYEEMKKKIDSLETHVLTQGSRENRDDEMRIVLLGKTGIGKSATGNTILGRTAFKSEASFESVTKESQRETSEINGRSITVIDTPGLFDTELTNEEIQREIRHCISMILPGPHVFLLLIPLGRFTKEEETSVKIIQETFGENSLMFTMVLFTRGDVLGNKTIHQCLEKAGPSLMNLIEACGHRFHVFNNNQPEERTQVSDLLEKIDNMVKANGGSFYSCKMFREMEREKQEQQMKILMDRVRETEEEMKKLEEEKDRMIEEERQNQEKDRKRREEELKREIREQEKHQREMREEMKKDRETFRHEIDEMRKDKEKLQCKYEKETDLLKNSIENERQNHDDYRKRREEEFKVREQQYKAQLTEMEREVQEKINKEGSEKLKQERERMERETEKLQSTYKEEENKMKRMMEELNREREELMKNLDEEKRRLKTIIEEESLNRDKERKRQEELKQEIREQEKHQRETRDEMKRERETFRHEIEDMKKDKEKMKTEYETEIERLMNRIEIERKNREDECIEKEQYKTQIKEKERDFRHEAEEMRREKEKIKTEKDDLKKEHDREIEKLMNRRKKREDEYREREEQYKTLIREKEEDRRETKKDIEKCKHEIEEIRKEKQKIKTDHETLQMKHDTEIARLMNSLDHERKRRNEYTEREEQYKTQIQQKEQRERETREQMKREREQWEKQTQEDKQRQEEEEERRQREKEILDDQIQRLRSEMEELIREKERTEREKAEQLEDLEKRLKEERNMREDQQKTHEETLKILEEQHEDQLKRKHMAWREEYEKEKEEKMEISSDTGSPQVKQECTETAEVRTRKHHLFHRLHLDEKLKLTAADVLQITKQSLQFHKSCTKEEELIQTFMQRLLMMNYRARYIHVKEINQQNNAEQTSKNSDEDEGDIIKVSLSNEPAIQERVHPMDVQMAVFHCADGFLKQLMVTKLSQCQFALPLLVPDPETQQIEFPLWTFRQITKSWKIRNTNNETISQTLPIWKVQAPMVFFFRFDSVPLSKSQLMNSLINEKHNTFFHRNCPGSSRSRVLMDGVVEIAWFCPSDTNEDQFTDCVAFCNLHGDAGDHEKQWKILTEMTSVNVVLLPRLDKHAEKIQNLYRNSKPLICLFTEDKSTVHQVKKGKFKIGLKDRNQSHVSEELRGAIRDCLAESSSTFSLEDLSKHSDIRVDEEDDEDCRRGRAAAQQMISLLEKKDLTEIKESFLPHQGKLWHQWSQKNKELHRPQTHEIEMEISQKQTEMDNIRELQHKADLSEFMKIFIKEINSDAANKIYFLKWLGIVLDEFNLDISLKLKLQEKEDQSEQQKVKKQAEFEAAVFGLEHIMREIAQIYESCSSVKENKKDLPVHFSSLPSLAAEMMISGFPLELMDGDAAHVPLLWISAVLDQLVQKLGDQTRVFVLSVLGIQSSGKSTMLNAMFGLQFPVSAGRCTRGAFMQLVKVSDEMKTQMNVDYILVVDTEGLCALELGGKSRHHDNELATFVVGLGSMTLINIFGENPSEMQEILQIVVQAFLRMKKVSLNPRCVFVHQNVSDVTAEEKNEEGRRILQETLDEMTKLITKEEVCYAERFSDVIKFDIENDVKYFPHLWDGNPPMAPPNPNYCQNIQDLKKTIMSHASKSVGTKLAHIKDSIKDLWEALLNEQLVPSFRNDPEILVYRKLETEYSKWSWSLRRAMMEIKNKMHNQIENEAIHEVEEPDLQRELKKTSEEVENLMSEFFEKDPDANILIQWKTSFDIKIKELQEKIVKETKRKLNEILQQRKLKKKIDDQRKHHENTLYEKSKELALKLKDNTTDEETLKKEFDLLWNQSMKEITKDTNPIQNIDIMRDVRQILGDICESAPVDHWRGDKNIFTVTDYSDYIQFKKSNVFTGALRMAKGLLDYSHFRDKEIRSFVRDVAQQTDTMIQALNISKMGFNISCIQQLTDYIKTRVTEHEKKTVRYVFRNEFFIDLVYSIFKRSEKMINDQHKLFRKANDPLLYLEKKREEYYSIFQKYCRGATSAAIFGEIICQKLKEPIEQSVCKETARVLADEILKNCESLKGNRSNLEKHILKTLAEEEDFDKYMDYIHHPKDHVKYFIRDEVSRFISDQFNASVLPKMKENTELLQQKILNAAHASTEHVQANSGDVGLWLKSFSEQLSDQLIFSEKDLSGVKHDDVDDCKLLEEVIKRELPAITSDKSKHINDFLLKLDYNDRPDELLIDQFCWCCWVQCPFCRATCTNTIEDHDGDHSVDFHRVNGLNGISYWKTTNLAIQICTSAVASKHVTLKSDSSELLYKDYRSAGGVFADWSITPDLSELPYWKWFVCRFQRDLEKYYGKTFERKGKIPASWRKCTKEDAIKSLDGECTLILNESFMERIIKIIY